MSEAKYLAIDLGAGSGRVMLGSFDGRRFELEELHRFDNPQSKRAGHIRWDVRHLFTEMKKGMQSAADSGHQHLQGIGVNVWGVDYALMDKDGELVANPVVYRDARTDNIMDEAFKLMPRQEMYRRTGIQFIQFNTVFQLYSQVYNRDPDLTKSARLLFMPDLFNYLITGQAANEYTISSTSQLLDVHERIWADDIFTKLGIPRHLMCDIIQPGTSLGKLLPSVCAEVNLGPIDVFAVGCHDTASAVGAVPAGGKNWAYLSSGTWSLLGVELDEPIVNDKSLQNNFTNEGGVGNKIRFLRNVMGLWPLQCCKKTWSDQGDVYSYAELSRMADSAPGFKCIIDPDDAIFLNPPDMPAAIATFCRSSDQPPPAGKPEIVRTIFESLALKYRHIIDMINTVCPQPVNVLHIVGGGSQNELLNQFAANATGLPVIAGPVEATALGNIMVQAIATDELSSIDQGRELIGQSFQLRYYQPQDVEQWQESYFSYKHLYE